MILDLSDNIDFVVESAKGKILNHTIPLVTLAESETHVDGHASAVLIKHGKQNFLVTAAHVYKDFDTDRVGFVIENEFKAIAGELKYTDVNHSDINHRVDLAITLLEDEVTQQLIHAGYEFFDLSSFNPDHEESNEPRYLIVGYPLTKMNFSVKAAKYKAKPFVFLTRKTDKYFDKLEAKPEWHILLEYQRGKVKKIKQKGHNTGPKPKGISGGGVWLLPDIVSADGTVPYYLTSIFIEHDNDLSTAVSTKYYLLTEILRNEFGANLPASKKIKII